MDGEFNINEYSITYFINGLSAHTDYFNYGAKITEFVPEEMEGYTFTGWSPELPATMPAHDIEEYGEYNVNEWTLTFHIDDRTDSSLTVAYGTELKPLYPEVDVDEGYYVHWDDKAPLTMPDNNLTINGTIEEITLSSDIYYGTALHNEIPGFTADSIKSLSHYSGEEEKEMSFETVIPLSEEYKAWQAAAEEADDEGDDELWEYYDNLMKEYRQSHAYGALFITPESVDIKDIVFVAGGYSVLSDPHMSVIKTVDVDGTIYTIREYSNPTEKAWQRIGFDQAYEFKIILN